MVGFRICSTRSSSTGARRRSNTRNTLSGLDDLVKRLKAGTAEETPEKLNTPGKRALYNNLGNNEELALRVNEAVTKYRPDGWRGNEAKERTIKKVLYKELADTNEVERIFLIIKAQGEY